MTTIPMIPESAPFTPEQRAWLNGFLAGVLNRGAAPAGLATPAGATVATEPLLVLYGSQSGNAESYSKKLAKSAATQGFKARAASMAAVDPDSLIAERNVLFVTSTWGEGEMPDNAQSFWDAINQNGSSPKLDGLRYSVLALGDSNYGDTFCLAGKKLDERLSELGALRVTARVDCDVDYDEPADLWAKAVFKELNANTSQPEEAEPEESGYSKKNPFPAKLIDRRALNNHDSAKETRHIALSLAGSGLVYEVGDALGVKPLNNPSVVDAVLASHDFTGEEHLPETNKPLRDALLSDYEIRHLLGKSLGNRVTAEAFTAGLRKLQPRLYSIASSPKAHPDEVHLTVGLVKYEQDGVQNEGVASTFLGERLTPGDTTGVFIHTANHFRLPADLTRPIVMVGPGTGIAPFRAFLEEREATRATGKNWLFFGDQHRASDFLYHDQIIDWVKSGHLTRLDTAFSRDQSEKIYVQTRMMEAAQEIWSWLEAGAYFYVCGDAKRMAKDVDQALHDIVQSVGGVDAKDYIAALKKAGRYGRDVY